MPVNRWIVTRAVYVKPRREGWIAFDTKHETTWLFRLFKREAQSDADSLNRAHANRRQGVLLLEDSCG